jgi:anthranilate phosphoribosyltransferase
LAAPLADLGGWPGLLGRLVAGEDIGAEQASAAVAAMLAGDATPAQVAGFLVALRMKGETGEEMAGMAEALLAEAEPLELPPGTDAVDTCGTGGSPTRRSWAFNVSTMAAFVITGAGGRVCKHGNRAASSTSGSADLLDALGVAFDLGPAGVARCVGEVGMGFCYAPRFHPAMRHVGPTRRELGVATVFNFLGPVANPARVRRQVVGVSDPAMAERVVAVLRARGAERALVVFGHDGLDELTTSTTSTMLDLHEGAVRTCLVDPEELGLRLAPGEAVAGGDAARNAAICEAVLGGEPGPRRDIVVLNAAAGLVAAGVVEDLSDGIEAATAAIDGGAAAAAVDRLVAVSREAAAAEQA